MSLPVFTGSDIGMQVGCQPAFIPAYLLLPVPRHLQTMRGSVQRPPWHPYPVSMKRCIQGSMWSGVQAPSH